MALKKYSEVAGSPRQPHSGPAQVQGADRNAPAGVSSVPRGTAHPAGESLAGTTEGQRHPPRVRDDVPLGLLSSPPGTRDEPDDEALRLAAGVDEAVAAVVDVTLAAGCLEGRNPGAAAGANISEGGDGREKFAEENEGVDGAPGGGAENAGVVLEGYASGPDAGARLGVEFACAALSTPYFVGGRPDAIFRKKSLAQAASTPESAFTAQQLTVPDMHVNTKARGGHRETPFLQQSSSGATTALEDARSMAIVPSSAVARSIAWSGVVSERDLDQTSLDGILGNHDVPPDVALLAPRVGQRMEDSFGVFAFSSANVLRSDANSLPKLVSVRSCVRSMTPVMVRDVVWLSFSPSDKDLGF